eukprot:Opistho-2@76786
MSLPTPFSSTTLTAHVTLKKRFRLRKKANCFIIGPVVESAGGRSYVLSVETDELKVLWMSRFQAALVGRSAAEMNEPKMGRARAQSHFRKSLPLSSGSLDAPVATVIADPEWRLKAWQRLVDVTSSKEWRNHDPKDGVTICRMPFKSGQPAAFKVETTIRCPPYIVLEFLKEALSPGGKFDYPFRGLELLLEYNEAPRCKVLTGVYDVPLPGVDPRSACLMRMWMGTQDTAILPVPPALSPLAAGLKGLLLVSVKHEAAASTKQSQGVLMWESGVILRSVFGQPGGMYGEHTLMQTVVQVDLGGSLQQMLKGAYRTGIVKMPVRSEYVRLRELAESHAGLTTH